MISSFTVDDEGQFDLLDKFQVCLSSGKKFTAVLKEDRLIKSLYDDPELYQSVGREFCVIFDIMYAN